MYFFGHEGLSNNEPLFELYDRNGEASECWMNPEKLMGI
jgi:hypothetical protein